MDPLPGTTDDNNDGIPEVNRLDEIFNYLQTLQNAADKYGTPIATNPVLIKGGHVYHLDSGQQSGVNKFEYHGTGINTESSHPFAIDHNVAPAYQALGAKGCGDCHIKLNFGQPSPVFDRLILVDPYDETGQPVYKTVRDLTGLKPW